MSAGGAGAAGSARVSAPVAAWRLGLVVLHVVKGYITIRLRFPKLSQAQREAEVASWAARLVTLSGGSLRVRGLENAPVTWWQSAMVVGNHISWLDIHALHVVCPARFVAKSEIGTWPLIGKMTEASRALYVERNRRRDVARINSLVADALRAGDCISVFPEGTTTYGDELLPFHANLFDAALRDNVIAEVPELKVIPFTLRYLTPEGALTRAPTYVGEQNLLDSMWQTLRGGPFVLDLDFLPALPFDTNTKRRELARMAEERVRAGLRLIP